MTVPQQMAFLVWYKTGLDNRTGIRSLRQTAKLTKHSLKTIVAWAEDFEWSKLAEAKDAEINQALEETFIASILEDKKSILKRQRTVISKLYKMIYTLIDKGSPIYDKDDSLKIIGYKPLRINFPDMIRLLEYETNMTGTGASRVGGDLYVLLQSLPSGERSGILSHYRSLRDSGGIPGDRLGSLGDVENPSRN